jgi:hypothetical protein
VETAGELQGALKGGWSSLDWADVRGLAWGDNFDSDLSLSLSPSLHSPLLSISGEGFSVYGSLNPY